MRIDIGAAVRARDGQNLGTVREVIIDPDRSKVTHLIVETGFLFGRLIVVPLTAVRRTSRREIWLKLIGRELRRMPDLVHTRYAAPPAGRLNSISYPAGSALWPGGYAYAPLVVAQEKAVPENSVEISRQTEVFALDGKIGVVSQVLIEPRAGKVTGFVVGGRKQMLRSVLVPITWISAWGGGRLSVSRTREDTIAWGEGA